jgi:predicted membrane protein
MENKKDKKDNRSFIGIIFLIIGLIWLGRNFDFIPPHISYILFSWQMLLVGIGILMIVSKKKHIGGLFMIGIGGVFLWDKIYPYSPVDWSIAWPVVLVFVGIALIIGYLNNSKRSIDKSETKPKEKKPKKSKYDDIEFDIDKIEPIED